MKGVRPYTNKACFYVMTNDSGFAPNPFHGICTLATCTPNHCRARLTPHDLIAGCFRSGRAVKIVYVMEVDETPADLDQYWRDPRFASKKPLKNGTCIEQAGDNLYHLDGGKWVQDENALHHKKGQIDELALANKTRPDWMKDIWGNKVFIGKRFVYFGKNAVNLPAEFVPWLPLHQGIKYLWQDGDSDLFARFRDWVFKRRELGRLSMPRDMDENSPCSISGGCQPI